MHDETYTKGHAAGVCTHLNANTETHRENVRFKCGANGQHLTGAGYKYINNNTHT